MGAAAEQVWKRDMLEQLEAVAVAEREAKEARAEQERQKELEAWRERRREQLERLIEVRFPTCCWRGVLKVNIHDQRTPLPRKTRDPTIPER